MRQAFNLAVDRRDVAQLYGGRDLATPTCQILPPGLPGYRPYCPYAHDVARARTLVSASSTQGQRVTVWSWTDDTTISPGVARYYASVLRELGYRASVHLVSHAYLADPPPSANSPFATAMVRNAGQLSGIAVGAADEVPQTSPPPTGPQRDCLPRFLDRKLLAQI